MAQRLYWRDIAVEYGNLQGIALKNAIKALLLATAGLLMSASGANANSIFTFDLTGANYTCSPACAEPYAAVTITQSDATHATVSFAGLSNSAYQYLLGGNGAAA